jgi:hypothetical protein
LESKGVINKSGQNKQNKGEERKRQKHTIEKCKRQLFSRFSFLTTLLHKYAVALGE